MRAYGSNVATSHIAGHAERTKYFANLGALSIRNRTRHQEAIAHEITRRGYRALLTQVCHDYTAARVNKWFPQSVVYE